MTRAWMPLLRGASAGAGDSAIPWKSKPTVDEGRIDRRKQTVVEAVGDQLIANGPRDMMAPMFANTFQPAVQITRKPVPKNKAHRRAPYRVAGLPPYPQHPVDLRPR